MSFKILDLTSGYRAIWHNKKHPLATYLDIRPEVNPDFVVNTSNITPEVGTDFDLIVYDPPHMNCGPNSNLSKRYGYFKTHEIKESIHYTNFEAHRVTKKNALMALKWNNHDIKLETVFSILTKWEPLFGHLTKNGPRSQTYWTMLLRKDYFSMGYVVAWKALKV